MEKLDKYQNSIMIDFRIKSKSRSVKEYSKFIFEEFRRFSPIKEKEDTVQYIQSLLCNFFLSASVNKTLSIPQDKNFYVESNMEIHNDIGYRRMIRIIDFLKKEGFIDFLPGFKNLILKECYTSVYWATSKLLSVMTDWQLEDIQVPSVPEIIMKDANKRVIRFKGASYTKALRAQIRTVNELYSQTIFHTQLNNDRAPVRLYPQLSAIFNNDSWECGGRLYCQSLKGYNYQNIRKAERLRITINGAQTVQPDYSGLHIHMLYAELGMQFNEAPYIYYDSRKAPYKQAILTLLNATTRRIALESLRHQVPNYDWQSVIRRIIRYHRPIKQFLGSGIGLKLQNKDGRMAIDILTHFVKRGIAVLPVHDSFIIAAGFGDELKKVMAQVYSAHNNGFSCPVK